MPLYLIVCVLLNTKEGRREGEMEREGREEGRKRRKACEGGRTLPLYLIIFIF